MRIRGITSILLVFLCGKLVAADIAMATEWTNELAAVFEKELRSGLDQPVYADQIVGLDKDSVAQQISHKQAACWVEALMRLAEKHSVELEDIFVGAEQGLINTDLLPKLEVSRQTADCVRVAFSSTGIDYDNAVQY